MVETAHRDAFARFVQRFALRSWDRLPDGSLFLQEREPDWLAGTLSTLHLIVTPEGERIERRFVHHVYSSKEWGEMLREAGFRGGGVRRLGRGDARDSRRLAPDPARTLITIDYRARSCASASTASTRTPS